MFRFLLPIVLLLAACETPRQQCISTVSKDLRVIDRLITTTEGNIERGYAISRTREPDFRIQLCGSPHDNFLFCNSHSTRLVSRPVAIDLEEETRILASLKKRRAEMTQKVQLQIASCAAHYPEG